MPFIFGRAVGNPWMKFQRLLKTGNFVTRWKTTSFQRLNLLYGVHFSVIIKMLTKLLTVKDRTQFKYDFFCNKLFCSTAPCWCPRARREYNR